MTGNRKKPRRNESIEDLYTRARQGERRALGRLLTRIERGGSEADQIGELANGDAAGAHVVGITGSPGAGKSTLTGLLVERLIEGGHRPAVLAVDPSSPLTGGAILGDRIRMESNPTTPEHSARAGAFIRSMATRGHSGGLALAVPGALRLFDAVGYGPIIIETVGVGQVEVDVVAAADTAVVVLTPGMGDAVQANKAGLLEVADVFVVNKADRPGANEVRRDIDLMLDLSHLTGQEDTEGYRPPIVMCSALKATGERLVWEAVTAHRQMLERTGRLEERRQHRASTEIRARLYQMLGSGIDTVMLSEMGTKLRAEAAQGVTSPSAAARMLFEQMDRR